MAKAPPKGFEQSRFDKEKPGVKEGSKEDMALDRKQAKQAGFMKRGGKVKGKGR